MSSQQHLSSRQLSHKPDEKLFQRDVIAPDKPPRVRWHSSCHVRLCRNCGQLFLFLLFLTFCFVMGPSFISFMYPNVIVPFNANLDWRCNRLEVYSQLQASNLVWETNLMTAASAINIQLYMKDKKTTLDDLEKVLLVVDDCGFDDFGGNVVLCRPVSNSGPRSTFAESVNMAEICYHYIRQMTKKAEILGYGKGIRANILIATAAKLREEYCFSFNVIFAEEPILNVKKEFEKNSWIGIAFMPPVFRERMMSDTIREYGLDKVEFEDNIKRVNTSIMVLTDADYESLYGNYGDNVVKGKKKKIFEFMQPTTVIKTPIQAGEYTFRHPNEGECVRNKNLTLTSVLVL